MMDLKWLKMMIMILSVGLCLVFTVTEAQISITINGSPSTIRRTLSLNDTMTIDCTVPSTYTSVSSLRVQRHGSSIKYFGNSYTGTMTKTITCDDNNIYFRCYGVLNGKGTYSNLIYVTVECPPTWSESVQQPAIFLQTRAENKYFDIKIIGQPIPTYSVQKFTSTGLQDQSGNINLDVIRNIKYVRLYFRTYSEDSHGVYQITANNSLGTLTTNITLRGLTLPPKNLIAWSSTTKSIHIEWTAGEIFQTAPRYSLYYKQEDSIWRGPTYISDTSSIVSYTFNSFKPNTTYYFLVLTYYSKFGYSFYSDMAMATTLSPGDAPQTKPPNNQPVQPTSSPLDVTSTTRPGLTTYYTEPVKEPNKVSEKNGGEKDGLTFEVGIGIGIGIGLILVIISVIGTVIYFKRSSVKREESTNVYHNTTTKSDPESCYENLDDNRPHDNAGVRYDNKAYAE